MHDYVIIGAGSAGCALASRLTEDPSASVALIEAGGDDAAPEIHVPAAHGRLIQSKYDWNLWSEPEPALLGRRLPLARGMMLGGCSSQNFMIYIRGNRYDYDRYAKEGALGWSYDELLPYFRRSEDNERGQDAFHGTGGPLSVSDSRSRHPLSDAFLDACQQAGHPANLDFNGARQEGVGRYQLTQRDGRRCSSAVAFLHPARRRQNLSVLTNSTVLRIVIEKGRAIGVQIERDRQVTTVAAAREVIVCAGTYHSAQLLMLSGVGPADELKALGIPVHQDLAVGRGLQDHPAVPLVWLTSEPTLYSQSTPRNFAMAYSEGRGPLTSNGIEAGGFFHSTGGLPAPDLQLHLAHAMFHEEGLSAVQADAYTILCSVIAPQSRGSVTLRSASPDHRPRIRSNFLGCGHEIQTMLQGLRLAMSIVGQPALRDRTGRPHLVPRGNSESELLDFIRQTGCTTYHPTSTCAIGTVVDPQLRVFGIEGLRVADASVLPAVPRGNTNAPAIMVAEKAADLIAGHALRSAVLAQGATLTSAAPRHGSGTQEERSKIRNRLVALAEQQAPVSDAELDAMWAELKTVHPSDILGSWRGAALNTGHSASRRLAALRWYGKTFHSARNTEPLVCRDEQGQLYSNTEASGTASLHTLPFRAELTATLVYHSRPILDHFKQVDDNTLMGIMVGGNEPSDGIRHFYFLLLRSDADQKGT